MKMVIMLEMVLTLVEMIVEVIQEIMMGTLMKVKESKVMKMLMITEKQFLIIVEECHQN